MTEPFSSQLYRLRSNARLTNAQLAALADVPESLISGLQNCHRRVGEYQALKIGHALGLEGEALERFVYNAINTCTEKVLKESLPYPAELLNLLAVQLNRSGVEAMSITDVTVVSLPAEQKIVLSLTGGKQAILRTQLVLN